MKLIIEPLSEQAWTRVETRLMERLQNDTSRESPRQRSHLPWPCEIVRVFTSMRHRVGSWLDLVADYGRGRASTDTASESGVHWRDGSATGVRMALPYR